MRRNSLVTQDIMRSVSRCIAWMPIVNHHDFASGTAQRHRCRKARCPATDDCHVDLQFLSLFLFWFGMRALGNQDSAPGTKLQVRSFLVRSEERRVGKECRSRTALYKQK